MSDRINRWLEDIGLGEHAESFVENDIDFDLLTRLSAEDLKELGLSVGHRRRFLDAVAKLKDAEFVGTGISGPSTPHGGAERRQLTIMFCDLVGSTELSQKLDPEDLREVNRAYQDVCKAAIERYEGYIARYMGDGVLVYFGYPQAHEDDAERAVRAGLGVVETMHEVNTNVNQGKGVDFAVRVGIATGPVVVGDLIGEGASQESAVVGETPNLAARLQGLADNNTVVIAPRTHELVGDRFRYDDLGFHSLKGIAESIHVWRVVGPVMLESRFETRQRAGLTRLVGREHEIGLLLDRWSQAKERDGQVVLLSGEAGIGKSRITETLRERTVEDEPIRLQYQSSPFYTNTALHPVIEQLQRAAHIEAADTNAAKLDKLESFLDGSPTSSEEAAPLLAPLLSISTEGRYASLDMTPKQQKERTLEVLLAQMEGLSRKQPVLLIFEDVHWADPTSLELLELAIDRAQRLPVLVVLTYRPQFSPTWSDHTHVTSLTLNRFSRSLSSTMVKNLSGGKLLPEEVLDKIIRRTDGVPLFIEELTKTILESGILTEESDRYVAAGPLSDMTIPMTLHDSLMGRLDRLGPVKDVAQTAAAIGREFDFDLLGAVSPLSFERLRDGLNELIDAGLVFRRGRSEEGAYIFKHALVQDAAYGSLLLKRRQSLHGNIAQALRQRFSKRVESEPELLAHHLTESGQLEPAIEQWRTAGLRAIASSTYHEAVAHLTKALELFAKLEDSGQRAREELSLLTSLATALTAVKGNASQETGRVLEHARELCRRVDDPRQNLSVLHGVYHHRWVSGDMQGAVEIAEECRDFGELHGDRYHQATAHSMLAETLLFKGQFAQSNHEFEQFVEVYDAEGDETPWLVYNPAITINIRRAWIKWFTGFPEQALIQSQKAIATARRSTDMVVVGSSLAYAGVLRCLQTDPQATRRAGQATIDFSTEHRLPLFVAFGSVLRGWAMASMGEPEEGVREMRLALEQWKTTGTSIQIPLFLALLSQGYASSGNYSEALKMLDEGLNLTRSSGERIMESEMHRLRGVYLLSAFDDEAAAESAFARGIEIAKAQESPSLELRAATNLARLWQGQGRHGEAREFLAPVYYWFTEGFDTANLKEAKALLDHLA